MVVLRAGLIFILLTAATLAAPLVPPAGFRQPPAAHALAETFSCPDAPPPFTGTLDFRSKYEGSDRARVTLNSQAEAAFHQQTHAIAEMEKFVSAHITAWHRRGDTREVSCLVTALNRWATAGALLGEARNHTGKSMRKWALATFSSGWLQLQFSKSHPLSAWLEAWCQLADCDNALRTRLASLRPLQNRRLGGPVTLLIGPKA